jgi:hypothetical protein
MSRLPRCLALAAQAAVLAVVDMWLIGVFGQ